MSLHFFPKPSRWTIGLIILATAITGTTVVYGISQFGLADQPENPASTVPIVRQIAALGRIEPATEVIQVSAPLELDGDRVAELLVKRGDRVKFGQVIAVLDSRDRLQTALLEAHEQVSVAQSKLAQVQAGAKSGEIAAQEAEITRLQAELQGEVATQEATIARWQSEVDIARAEYERFRNLYREGAESASQLDSKRLALETAEAQLNEAIANQSRTADTLRAQISEAQATLDQIAEVRPVDIQAAQAEVDAAIAAVQKAQAELEQAFIYAPIAGQVLEIHTHPGEAINDDGIVDLGQTDQMEIVAEVYQTDIGKVQTGQSAVITSQAFPGELHGTVGEVGLQVSRQEVFSNEPGENLDRRVIEVRIRLSPEDSQKVAGLTNLQVQVAIEQL
ncbi:MAG: ABC exporter membrane fusion protein [Cyanobacteria bacterium CRU_2_1]|nr:ABC exporter membrane fusion protein [Cyanobacteria bacterium RU_5_0]NJR58959.1 ABC exporter membrane fusion protein [Cyanobacteria bacterium CRU_2_1]